MNNRLRFFVLLFALASLLLTGPDELIALSEEQLVNIRDRFDQRVAAAFEALRGQPLQAADIRPPIGPGRPENLNAFSGSIMVYAMRCFWLEEDLENANQALIANDDAYLEIPERIYDRDNYHWHADVALRIVDLFGANGSRRAGLLSAEAERKIMEASWLYAKRVDQGKETQRVSEADHEETQTWRIRESENHHAQSFTLQWHFAKLAKDNPEFRDRLYYDGKTAAEHYRQWNEYLKLYMLERAKKGLFVEMMSPNYNHDLLKGFFNIYDFADDEELRRRTGFFLDLYLAYWAEEQIDRISGGGKSRIYADMDMPSLPYGYYYFGLGNQPNLTTYDLTAMTSSYRPPLVVVDIAVDVEGRGVYEVVQHPLGLKERDGLGLDYIMRQDYGGITRYTYATPDFIMGTAMVEARPHTDWTLISAQNRSHGVIFAGHPKAAVFPQTDNPRSSRAYNSHWSVQRRGTLIAQKLDTSSYAGDSRVWFSSEGLSSPIEEDGWVFVESKGAYAGVRIVQGGTEWVSGDRYEGQWLYCENEYTPIILEADRKSNYTSFESFREKVERQPIRFRDGVLVYEGIYGDTFTFYADHSQPPRINDSPVEYSGKAFDSPFLQSEWNSGIVRIRKGGREVVLDFNDPQ